ncbi:MAG: transcription elongation factor GreB [Hyphomicrobiaceae bacterium]|jgi:transcription elongation factor GreB
MNKRKPKETEAEREAREQQELADEEAEIIAEAEAEAAAKAGPFKNYITPAGYRRLNDELTRIWTDQRPKLVETISWAASNGDRSENGDYIYGKRKLRQIDSRIRFLSKQLDTAVIVDNTGKDHEQVYFGATVTVAGEEGDERTVSIVGVNEEDAARGRVSWISPIAKALMNAQLDEVVTLRTPKGPEQIEVVKIRYEELP